MLFVMMPVIAVAFFGLAWSWRVTWEELRNGALAPWRRTAARMSILAVTAQLVLMIVMIVLATRPQNRSVPRLALIEGFFCVIALSCAVTRTNRSRWWLLFGSLVFGGFSGFVFLVSQITF